MRRRLTAVLFATLVMTAGFTAPAVAGPLPVLPAAESLITEGLTIEGPLVNNLVLPQL